MNILPRAIIYPGAKTKAVWQLTAFLPERFDEVIEPFAGSAALSIHLLDKRFVRSENVWLNDVNAHLMNFYRVLVSQTDLLVMSLLRIHRQHGNGNRELFERACATLNDPNAEPLQKAIAYFIHNRLGYAVKQRFVEAIFWEALAARPREGLQKPKILRLLTAAELLKRVRLTEADYRSVFTMAKPRSFFFLDPPYPLVTKDMYGPEDFDDEAFVEAVQQNKNRFLFLLTLSDTERNRAAFSNFLVIRKSAFYSLRKSNRSSGSEIMAMNYIPHNFSYWVEKHGCEVVVNPVSKEPGFLVCVYLAYWICSADSSPAVLHTRCPMPA